MATRPPVLTSCAKYAFHLAHRLGTGSEAHVYRGCTLPPAGEPAEEGEGSRAPPATRAELVAIKLLKAGGTPHELTVLRDIPPHPHIVPVPELVTCGHTGRPILVFPLFPSDLFSVVEARGPLPEHTVVRILTQLLHALAHVHKAGYSHCDVKLDNVFVRACDPDGSVDVVLADFGLARRGAWISDDYSGTLEYLAPEVRQASRGQVAGVNGPAADVWSLAVLALFCLCMRGVSMRDDVTVVFDEGGVLSPAAHDFFSAALCVCPSSRPSPSALLAHPWLAPASPSLSYSLSDSDSTDAEAC